MLKKKQLMTFHMITFFWFQRLGLFLINEVHECIELVYTCRC